MRGLTLERVQELIDDATDGRLLGFFGEPGVNVLELNLALDRETGRHDTPERRLFSREIVVSRGPGLLPQARPADARSATP